MAAERKDGESLGLKPPEEMDNDELVGTILGNIDRIARKRGTVEDMVFAAGGLAVQWEEYVKRRDRGEITPFRTTEIDLIRRTVDDSLLPPPIRIILDQQAKKFGARVGHSPGEGQLQRVPGWDVRQLSNEALAAAMPGEIAIFTTYGGEHTPAEAAEMLVEEWLEYALRVKRGTMERLPPEQEARISRAISSPELSDAARHGIEEGIREFGIRPGEHLPPRHVRARAPAHLGGPRGRTPPGHRK